MRRKELDGGGIQTLPETADEKRLHEIGVSACLKAIAEEREEIDTHRENGADAGSFQDIGLEEALEAMEEAGADHEEVGDAINAVCTDERVEKALNEFLNMLDEEEER